jgi:NADH-quinone oxidoreductase subunit M
LASGGLPLTLGYYGENLLLHGILETHSQLGIVLPLVTALNAFHVLRLFARLFLGRPIQATRGLSDALPRERWALTLALLFLLIAVSRGVRPVRS